MGSLEMSECEGEVCVHLFFFFFLSFLLTFYSTEMFESLMSSRFLLFIV